MKTPAVDWLANNGVHFAKAFVTTSLCSPCRASILTGLYAHTHRVVDNQSGTSDTLRFFSQDLQDGGYRTAFIGKWHMGNDGDAPKRGWHHWVSFTGQGNYFPDLPNGKKALLNVDGQRVPQTAYITDELTDYSLKWLPTVLEAAGIKAQRPFHGRSLLPLARGEKVANWRSELILNVPLIDSAHLPHHPPVRSLRPTAQRCLAANAPRKFPKRARFKNVAGQERARDRWRHTRAEHARP